MHQECLKKKKTSPKVLVLLSFMCWSDSIVNAAVVKFNALGAPGKALFDGRKRLSCDVARMKVWNVQQKEAFLNITWVDNGNHTDEALIKGSG